MARPLRIEKLKAIAVLKAMVLRVAISQELANRGSLRAQACTRPQASAVSRTKPQWRSSQVRSACGVSCAGRRWSRRSASSRAKSPAPARPQVSSSVGLALNSQVSNHASR
ncbi:hypothetical protein D3C86_1556530 [compost metagenome]